MTMQERYLEQAVRIAKDNVLKDGKPYGALLVLASGAIYEGVEDCVKTSDPTAHAEINALRQAGKVEETINFPGAVLYSSAKPCRMCIAAAGAAQITNIVFTATPNEAEKLGLVESSVTPILERSAIPERKTPFEQWKLFSSRDNGSAF
jgi:guanine deaminase